MDGTALLIGLVGGAALGGAAGWLFGRGRGHAAIAAAETAAATERARAEGADAARVRVEDELRAVRSSLEGAQTAHAAVQARLGEVSRQSEEKLALLEQAEAKLREAFTALSAQALRSNNEQFLSLARETLERFQHGARGDLDARQKAIETLVSPLRDTLGKLETRTNEIEKARGEAYSRIDEQVKALAQATQKLEAGTNTLATALRSSQVRGKWGEIALRNVAELAGMSEHCDFTEQESADDGSRPDMTVRLPGGRLIAIDAKAPLVAYLDAVGATTDAERDRHLDAHVAALRGHVRALAGRNYPKALGADVDLVVLFLPGDPFLAAAFARAPDLQIEALRSRVLVATPTTLVALLRTVAIYHQQESLARNAAEIASVARELYERGAKFGEDLGKLGKGLQTAMRAYNEAVASFDTRFVPMARRLDELRVAEQSKRSLAAPDPVDEVPRLVRSAGELQAG